MADGFHEDLIAELLAMNTALVQVIVAIGSISGDRKGYCEKLLEAGDQAMATTNIWSILPERREEVLENARARFAEIVSAANPKS